MEGKNENLSPHLNMQYFAAASNEFQFPSPEVNTWIINEWRMQLIKAVTGGQMSLVVWLRTKF